MKADCTKCVKNKRYELLKTVMVGAPGIIFCWYVEAGSPEYETTLKPVLAS